jgi:RluA family pseudouridine synthase
MQKPYSQKTIRNVPCSFRVAGLERPARLDQFLRVRFPAWGRQAVQKLIAGRKVQVNGRNVWLDSWEVSNGDRITVACVPADKPAAHAAFEDRWLIADDDHLIVVDKPEGLLSEAPPRREASNLRDLATARFGSVTLVHRLDRDTSGVVVLARTPEANRMLTQAFQQHKVVKEYVAVVHAPNRLLADGEIDARLAADPKRDDHMCVVAKGGRRALTRYTVTETGADRQQVHLLPTTGRTHQLRIHLAHLGAPILGDRIYGDIRTAPRLMLHAWRITLPAEGGAPARTFTAPLPPEFDALTGSAKRSVQ